MSIRPLELDLFFDNQGPYQSGLVAVDGLNFSGRTNILRRFAGLATDGLSELLQSEGRAAYVGPEIYNCLSGLVLSVEEEIALHMDGDRSGLSLPNLLDALGLTELRERNPFELSGGEQAMTALASAIALGPSRLSLDCCFEQVDSDMRERVMTLLSLGRQERAVAIADNRLQEYSLSCQRVTSWQTNERPTSPFLLPVAVPEEIPSSGPAPTIELDQIRFGYRSNRSQVLKDVSVTLQPGNIYLLEGRNGSGKSTLAKVLSGILRPQSGILRKDAALFEPFREPARVFAYHFQNPDLQLFCSRVGKELLAGPQALGMSAQTREAAVHIWAKAFGLKDVLTCHPLDLPFVGRKRVALAATLAMARPWLILDEPTLGQDDLTSDVFARILHEWRARGFGAIVISHSTRFRDSIAGRRLLLEGGMLFERQ